jgi:hypothetical protein
MQTGAGVGREQKGSLKISLTALFRFLRGDV